MKFEQNPRLKTELLTRLRTKYINPRAEMPHLSELLYCLTKAAYERRSPIPVTDAELIMFCIGFGLEDVILRDDDTVAPVTVEFEGVWMTPDYVVLGPDNELDLKSTRMYPDNDGSPKRGWPEGWIKQFMAYSYREAMTRLGHAPEYFEYSVGIIYLTPARLEVGTLTWTRAEVLENWEKIATRRNIFMGLMGANQIPTPFSYNEDWECKTCRYKLRCIGQASQNAGGLP